MTHWQTTNCRINGIMGWLRNWCIDVDWWIDGLLDWWADWRIDGLINWQIDWLVEERNWRMNGFEGWMDFYIYILLPRLADWQIEFQGLAYFLDWLINAMAWKINRFYKLLLQDWKDWWILYIDRYLLQEGMNRSRILPLLLVCYL